MQVATSFSTAARSREAAIAAYVALVAKLQEPPGWLAVQLTVSHDAREVLEALAQVAPTVAVHGGTSCLGLMTEDGVHGDHAIGLLGICDPQGTYGVGVRRLGLSPRQAARDAAVAALRHADRQGEVPAMVWITCAPGAEELVLAGLADLFGPRVPIAGGSAADNTAAGEWLQLAAGEVHRDAVVVSVMFVSTGVSFSFHSGYDPSEHRAVVTRSAGRTIYELDGRPAALVYDEWNDHAFRDVLHGGGAILSRSALMPLGRVVGQTAAQHFQLGHPSHIGEDRSLSTFCDFEAGDTLIQMRGTPATLVRRAEQVARAALRASPLGSTSAAGALVVYCAGGMLAVRERMPEVVTRLCAGLGEAVPFLGMFSFGEQGCFPSGENRHGNLMISVLVFLS